MDWPRCYPSGDSALLMQFAESPSDQVLPHVVATAEAIRQAAIAGVTDCVSAYTTIMVSFDLAQTSYQELQLSLLQYVVQHPPARSALATVEIPVCYDSSLAWDIQEVIEHLGIDVELLVARHSEPDYQVSMLGFMPGFLYLSGMDARISCPRKATPRIQIPAGAVGIAGAQTGVYPFASPGGWQIIGQTPLKLFDPTRNPPVLATHLQSVRFVPITLAEFEHIKETQG